MKNILLRLMTINVLILSPQINAADNGELWELSMSFDGAGMSGMALPPTRECLPPNKATDPEQAMKGQDNCSVSDYKVSGNKSSWKFKCTGNEPMTGRAEMLGSATDYTMTINANTARGETKMLSKGKKVGSCNYATDSSAAKFCNQMNQSMAEMKKQQTAECKQALEKNRYESFLKAEGMQAAGPEDKTCGGKIDGYCSELKPKMCEKLGKTVRDFSSKDGYMAVYRDRSGVKLAGECGLAWESVSRDFCGKQLADKNYDNLAYFCEAEAKPLFEKYCVGRDYTAQMDSPYRAICSKFGKRNRGAAETGDSADMPQAGNAGGTVNNNGAGQGTFAGDGQGSAGSPAKYVLEGAKKLKDLFGF